jgi:hypothetical protein
MAPSWVFASSSRLVTRLETPGWPTVTTTAPRHVVVELLPLDRKLMDVLRRGGNQLLDRDAPNFLDMSTDTTPAPHVTTALRKPTPIPSAVRSLRICNVRDR